MMGSMRDIRGGLEQATQDTNIEILRKKEERCRGLERENLRMH